VVPVETSAKRGRKTSEATESKKPKKASKKVEASKKEPVVIRDIVVDSKRIIKDSLKHVKSKWPKARTTPHFADKISQYNHFPLEAVKSAARALGLTNKTVQHVGSMIQDKFHGKWYLGIVVGHGIDESDGEPAYGTLFQDGELQIYTMQDLKATLKNGIEDDQYTLTQMPMKRTRKAVERLVESDEKIESENIEPEKTTASEDTVSEMEGVTV